MYLGTEYRSYYYLSPTRSSTSSCLITEAAVSAVLWASTHTTYSFNTVNNRSRQRLQLAEDGSSEAYLHAIGAQLTERFNYQRPAWSPTAA